MARTVDEIIAARAHEPGFEDAFERAKRSLALGDSLRQRRLALGITQSALAKLAGCSRAVIARIESGDADPRIDTLRQIGSALGVEVVLTLSDPSAA